MVSVIIPFKDRVGLLRRCMGSIVDKSTFGDYEIILVDNQSKEKKTFEFLETLKSDSRITVLQYDKPFNYSAINNFAAKYAKGGYLLFLNNDTEVISKNWLEKMLECFDNEKVGAVGAKLLYPNGKIQHIGVEMHPKYGPVHTLRLAKEEGIDFNEPKEVFAVTAACMMTKKDLFLQLGGFDEVNLPIAYNDVDYCLRLRKQGYKIICTPHAKLYHHESASRKSDVLAKIFNRKRYKQFLKEREEINTRVKSLSDDKLSGL